jgi:hypothetical protein
MYERECSHCGCLYYATALDEAILDFPLCLSCISSLGEDAIVYLGKNPHGRASSSAEVSQAVPSRTAPIGCKR